MLEGHGGGEPAVLYIADDLVGGLAEEVGGGGDDLAEGCLFLLWKGACWRKLPIQVFAILMRPISQSRHCKVLVGEQKP